MSSTAYVLAIDGGGTKTLARLYAETGATLAETRAGPCNLYQDEAGGFAAIETAWAEVCARAGLDPATAMPRACLSAGLAGISTADAAQRFRRRFAGFARRRLSSDGYAVLIGAFEGRPGALLSIGTGVVAFRLWADGRFAQLGGWGFPAGDQGGGAWLGLRLIGAWLEHLDGGGPFDPASRLPGLVAAALGQERASILRWLRQARPGDFAAFAEPMLAAAKSGDSVAQNLLDEAFRHLLPLATALHPTLEEPLALAGGLASAFRPRLAEALGKARVAQDLEPSPLHGAWLIGRGAAPPEFPDVT
jgi:glucosamine kinase